MVPFLIMLAIMAIVLALTWLRARPGFWLFRKVKHSDPWVEQWNHHPTLSKREANAIKKSLRRTKGK